MRALLTVTSAAMALGIAFVMEAFGGSLSTYTIGRTTEPIQIDGLL